jgi:phosphopantetheinyl transferase (holo-ACP synthase)
MLMLSGKASDMAAMLKVKRISISLTHTESTAMAQVIFED